MCGIVGYTGKGSVIDILIKGLRRLEYRGYDSSGIAFNQGGKLEIVKAQGKLQNVEDLLRPGSAIADVRAQIASTVASSATGTGPVTFSSPPGRAPTLRVVSGNVPTAGIGHTRWATHGKPTTRNAHPHRTGHVVLVHNGIIENYQEIKKELISRGHEPQSETDSELFGFLVLERMDQGLGLTDAVRESFARIHGQCSVLVMSEKEPDVIVGVRNGSPLVAAVDPRGGVFLASDAQPILEHTREVIYLENGQMVVCAPTGLDLRDLATGELVEPKTTYLDWSVEKLDKQGYAHYMLKEIHEQPAALIETLNAVVDRGSGEPFALQAAQAQAKLREAREIILVACGTAAHAAMVGKYWLESWGKIRVSVELASEFRYREPVMGEGTLLIAVSQSGETADTLAAAREAKRQGVPTMAITNCRGSSLAREVDQAIFTAGGPEIGVAATKTFSTQMLALLCLAGNLAAHRAKTEEDSARVRCLYDDLVRLPHLVADNLSDGAETKNRIQAISKSVQDASGFYFIGRGFSYPLALEGALKLKEISYLHAEGYPAGELKHGPIAMIDEKTVVVAISPRDYWRDKTVSNLEEVKARGAVVLGIGSQADTSLQGLCEHWAPVMTGPSGKTVSETLFPFLVIPMLQLLSYEVALLKGTDVDKPRNLAKSVTVE